MQEYFGDDFFDCIAYDSFVDGFRGTGWCYWSRDLRVKSEISVDLCGLFDGRAVVSGACGVEVWFAVKFFFGGIDFGFLF